MTRRIRLALVPMVGTLGVIMVFQALSMTGVIPQGEVASPWETLTALVSLVGESSFWSEAWITLQAWALGLGLAMAVAIPLGFFLGSNRFAFGSTRVVIDFLRPIPTVALLPLFILLFSGIRLTAYTAAIGAFWPLLIQAIYGVRDVDPVARETARAYRLGRLRTAAVIILPSSLPYLATGIRIGGTIALAIVVGAQMIVGSPGLGDAIIEAQQGLRVDKMYALIAATGLLGVLLSVGLRMLERWTLSWHPSQLDLE